MKCYYFGTFNPVHNAHLQIADEVQKRCVAKCGFEKVIFVPAFCPPHKDSELAEPSHRLNMLTLAVGKENVCDIEYKIETPSYTYKTLEHLGECYFIAGYDAFLEIESWKHPEQLKKLLNFIVIPRRKTKNTKSDPGKDFLRLKEAGFRFEILELDFMDISSDDIRKRIRKGMSIKGLVPKEVEEYIYENDLYR